MLRRYSSRGLDSLPLDNKKTIGSGDCNIVIKADGVSSLHAVIEYHPLSRTYWLRDISITGVTTVNGQIVNGQSELQNGDLIRIGESQPMVFEDSHLRSLNIDAPMNSIPRTNVDLVLPVLGRRIKPESATRRSLSGAFYTTTAPSVMTTAKPRNRRSLDGKSRETRRPKQNGDVAGHSGAASLTETGSDATPRENGKSTKADFPSSTARNNSTTGDNLLQRVVRLQAEIARKDDEIVLLNHRLTNAVASTSPVEEVYRRASVKNNYQDVTRFPSIRRSSTLNPTNQNFELEAYRAFVGSLAHRLRMFNDKLMSQPLRDYGDIFTEFCRSLEQPFSTKMLEIARDCEMHLESRGFDAIQRCRLRSFVEDERKEHIAAMMSEVEMIAPVILDGMNIARESCRACAVFTHWSRHLGDNLRVEGLKSSILNDAIDALKEDYANAQMSRHWLPPSIIPLIKLIALDVKKREDGVHKDSQTGAWEDERLTLVTEEASKHQDETEQLRKKLEEVMQEKNELMSQIESLRLAREQEIRALEESAATVADDVDSILSNTERQIDELKTQMNNLGTKIDDAMDLDDAIEKRITVLIEKIHDVTDPLAKLKQNERKTSSNSIVSIDVSATDLEDGMKHLSRENSFQLEGSTEEIEEPIAVKVSPKKESGKLKTRISTIQEESEDEEEQKQVKEELRSFYHRLCMYLHEFPQTDGEFGKIIMEKELIKDMITKGNHLLNRLDEVQDNQHAVVSHTPPDVFVIGEDSEEAMQLSADTELSNEGSNGPRHKRDTSGVDHEEPGTTMEQVSEPEVLLQTLNPVESSVEPQVTENMAGDAELEQATRGSDVDSLDGYGLADSRVQSDEEPAIELGHLQENEAPHEGNIENEDLHEPEIQESQEDHGAIGNETQHLLEQIPESQEYTVENPETPNHQNQAPQEIETAVPEGEDALENPEATDHEAGILDQNGETQAHLENHVVEDQHLDHETPSVLEFEKVEAELAKAEDEEAKILEKGEELEMTSPKNVQNHEETGQNQELQESHDPEHDEHHLNSTASELVDDVLAEHTATEDETCESTGCTTQLPTIEPGVSGPTITRGNSEDVKLPPIGNHVGSVEHSQKLKDRSVSLPRIEEVPETHGIPKLDLPEGSEPMGKLEIHKERKKQSLRKRLARSMDSTPSMEDLQPAQKMVESKKKTVSIDLPEEPVKEKGGLPNPLNKGLTVDSLAEDVSVRMSDDEIHLDSDSDESLNEFQSNRIPLDVVEERQERRKKREDAAKEKDDAASLEEAPQVPGLTDQNPEDHEAVTEVEHHSENEHSKESQEEDYDDDENQKQILDPNVETPIMHHKGNGTIPNMVESNLLAERTEEEAAEDRLLKARKEVSSSLASSFLGSEKPKSVCEISHSAHIQSHINTATKVPVVYNQIPVHRMLSESPPIKRKAPPSEEKKIRQPRMLFY